MTKHDGIASLTDAADGAIETLALAQVLKTRAAQNVPEAQAGWSLTSDTLRCCLKNAAEGRAELLKTGMPEDVAALLLAGLAQQCAYCCVNTVHLRMRTLESLCLVYNSDMLLRLEPGEIAQEDWIVRRSTPEEVLRTLRALLREETSQ